MSEKDKLISQREKILKIHGKLKGKIEISSKLDITNKENLALAYTSGSGIICQELFKDPQLAKLYTIKNNFIAIVSNGTAVLGLGDIGAQASLPVLEAKSVLIKQFAGVNMMPIAIDSRDPKEVVDVVKKISVNFAGIMLEDIKAPECIEIEERLQQELNIPVMHDDQHGTAIAVLAALINSLRLKKKNISSAKIVICGVGAAGSAIVKIMYEAGAKNILAVDKKGIISRDDPNTWLFKDLHRQISQITNPNCIKGDLSIALDRADVFVGVSSSENRVDGHLISKMNTDPVVFAMSLPVPEVYPEVAAQNGAFITATGRSEFKNQINNSLAFPGIFRSIIKYQISKITMEMKVEVAKAISKLISDEELSKDYVIPTMFNDKLVLTIEKTLKKYGNY